MKTALILLLGNRDIQIHKDKFDDVKAKFAKYFVLNQDDENYYIVDKFNANKTDKSFIEISEIIWNEYDYFSGIIEYRLWELSYKILQKQNIKIDKIIITTSKQDPVFKQDTFNFAYSFNRFLKEKGFNTDLKLCEENPTNFESMVSYYINLFNEVSKDYSKIYISNTGGTPQMRTSSHFAGIFRNFEYISIGSTDKAASKTFKNQENQILKQIVEKMLAVYDYAGIEELPIDNIEIKKLANYALSRIHLNHSQAVKDLDKIKNNKFYDELKQQVNTKFSIQALEKELYLTAKIKFQQKAFADYLWRLFTIQDNLLIPIIEKYFNEEIIFNSPDHPEWNNLLSKFPVITNKLDLIKLGKKPLDYSYPNKFVYKQIYKIITNNKPDILIYSIDNILTSLGDLRNSIAHNYGSIGIEELNNNISVKQLRKALKIIHKDLSEKELEEKINIKDNAILFNSVFNFYIKIKEQDFGIYDQINKKIISLL